MIGEFASSSHDSGCTVQNIVQYFEVHIRLSGFWSCISFFLCPYPLVCSRGSLYSSKQIVILLQFNPNCVLFLGV